MIRFKYNILKNPYFYNSETEKFNSNIVKVHFKGDDFVLKLRLLIWLQTDAKLFKLSYLNEIKLAGTIYHHFTDKENIYVISEDGIISNQFPVEGHY